MTRAHRSAVLGAAVLLATACGSSAGDDNGKAGSSGGASKAAAPAGKADTYILGTTDKVVALDPAGAYDLGSQQLIGNIYQNLMVIPAGGNTPTPDAAQSCDFTDPKTYVCKLKSGLKFSSGDPLTSEDVKFSLDRQLKIADPSGPSSLLASLKSVDATDPMTVTMHLKKPDGTWPYVLTHNVAAIVPSKIYPADKKQPDDKVIGSGPYELKKYVPNQQAVFTANPNYTGPNKAQTPNVIVQYYDQPSALKLAIEQGDVDIAYRSLSPTDIQALKGESDKGIKVVDGAGTEIRYITFNVTKPPVEQHRRAQGDRADHRPPGDRDQRLQGHGQAAVLDGPRGDRRAPRTRSRQAFGDPSVDKAKQILADAGVQTPINLDGWYTPTHYGPVEVDLWNEIKRQLEASGLFKVKLDSTEWTQYKDAAFAKHQYYFYGLGWFPDYPDGDNYLAPFMRDGGFFQNGYKNADVDKALDSELGSSDEDQRAKDFGTVQDAEASDVPLIPLWEGKQIAAVKDGVEGVEKTFDPAFQFRFWLVTKKG